MTAYTNSLRLTLPVTGTDDGTWGETVNNGITTLIDASVAGTATVAHDNTANYALTDNDGATDEARYMFLNITGTLTAARNVVCPGVSNFVTNNTTGGYAITLKTSGGTGISIATGKRAALYCDGTNVVYAFDQVTLQPTVSITGNMDSGTTDYAVTTTPAIQSAVTTAANIYYSAPTTQATSFTLTNLRHYYANQGTFGAGSTVTNQYGFITSSGLTGATFNYGFHGNIAATASVEITSISGTGSTATVESAASHGLTTGDYVFISGTSTAGFNGGPFTVTVVDSNTFTYSSTETTASTGGYSTQTNDWNFYSSGTAPSWFGGPTVISANSRMDGLRITQAGGGNALVVEDSTNPDTTPFVITASGNVGIGTASPASALHLSAASAVAIQLGTTGSGGREWRWQTGDTASGLNGAIRLYDVTGTSERMRIDSSGNVGIGTTSPATILEAKTATGGLLTLSTSDTIVSTGDVLGGINFQAPNEASGSQSILVGASISAVASIANFSTTANNTDIVFSTNATAASPTERMRITSTGEVLVGGTTTIEAGSLGVQATDASPFINLFRNDTSVVTGNSLGTIRFYGNDTTSNTPTNLASIQAVASGTHAAGDNPTDIAFNTTPDGSATIAEAMRIRGDGGVGLGGTGSATVGLYLQKNITGGTVAYGTYLTTDVQSDVTSAAYGYRSYIGTQTTTFTVSDIAHYYATQGVYGAGSTVTNQYGFIANASLVGATNNYGFWADIPASANDWNFYADGTAANYFAGDVRANNGFLRTTSVNNSNTSVTLTASSTLPGGIRTGTPAANINYTVPTGTNCDAYFTSLQTSMGAEWSIVNLAAATYSITVLANTDHTVVGNMVVAANTSARFLSRKTGTNTFVTYRIA